MNNLKNNETNLVYCNSMGICNIGALWYILSDSELN